MMKNKKVKLAVQRTEECSLPSRRDFLEKGKMVALALLGITIGAKSAEGQTDKNKHFRTVEIPGVVESITYQCAGGNCTDRCVNLCPCHSQCSNSGCTPKC